MSRESRRRETQQGLRAATVVGVVRNGDGARAEQIARVLLEAGLPALEVTANTPGVFETIAKLCADFPHAILGVGTVRTTSHLRSAVSAGARFVVSPHTDRGLIHAAKGSGLTVIPGALTPTEIVTAQTTGADFVKVFPISTAGGPSYLRALAGPLPDVAIWVSGQVSLAEIPDYLAAGAELIGLTGALTAGLPDAPAEAARVLHERALQANQAVIDFRDGTALLTIRVGDRVAEVGMKALRRVPGTEHSRLEALVPGRRGHAVRLRVLLQSAGLPPEAEVRLVSHDGFTRTVSARALYEGGLLHYATDGHPLGRDQGGPLRLYIVHGTEQCDNLKGLARIETVSQR